MLVGEEGRILEEFAEQQGWDVESMLDLCVEYIGNQGSPLAFRDFLQTAADIENEVT